VKGDPGQSCSAACAEANAACLESEEHWPKTAQAFAEIARLTGYECTSIHRGDMQYDPSADSAYCGWSQWRTSQWQSPKPSVEFCSVEPPSATVRFCPCGEPLLFRSLVSLTLESVDYTLLCDNSSILSDFLQTSREAVADEVGGGVVPEDVNVMISAGSVAVLAAVTPPSALDAESWHSRLPVTVKGLGRTLLSRIEALDGIDEVSTGALSVSDVTVWPRPAADIAIKMASGATDGALTEALRVRLRELEAEAAGLRGAGAEPAGGDLAPGGARRLVQRAVKWLDALVFFGVGCALAYCCWRGLKERGSSSSTAYELLATSEDDASAAGSTSEPPHAAVDHSKSFVGSRGSLFMIGFACMLMVCIPLLSAMLASQSWTLDDDQQTGCNIYPGLSLLALIGSGSLLVCTKMLTLSWATPPSALLSHLVDCCYRAISSVVVLNAFVFDTFAGRFFSEMLQLRKTEDGALALTTCGSSSHLQGRGCLLFASPVLAEEAADQYFGWHPMLLLMLGSVLICIADLMLLTRDNRFVKDLPGLKMLLDCKFAASRTREIGEEHMVGHAAAGDEIPGHNRLCKLRDEFALGDLRRATCPFIFQAFALALWLPVDYIKTAPCLGYADEAAAPGDAAGFLRVLSVWTPAVGAGCLALGLPLLCANLGPRMHGNVLISFWAIAAVYCCALGTFGPISDIWDEDWVVLNALVSHTRALWLAFSAGLVVRATIKWMCPEEPPPHEFGSPKPRFRRSNAFSEQDTDREGGSPGQGMWVTEDFIRTEREKHRHWEEEDRRHRLSREEQERRFHEMEARLQKEEARFLGAEQKQRAVEANADKERQELQQRCRELESKLSEANSQKAKELAELEMRYRDGEHQEKPGCFGGRRGGAKRH